jgi:hypothetical protein
MPHCQPFDAGSRHCSSSFWPSCGAISRGASTSVRRRYFNRRARMGKRGLSADRTAVAVHLVRVDLGRSV